MTVLKQGISTTLFIDQPSLYLVSNGAECIMINKSLYQQHCPRRLMQKLRTQVGESCFPGLGAGSFFGLNPWLSCVNLSLIILILCEQNNNKKKETVRYWSPEVFFLKVVESTCLVKQVNLKKISLAVFLLFNNTIRSYFALQMSPYPTEESLQNNLLTRLNWDNFKMATFHQVIDDRRNALTSQSHWRPPTSLAVGGAGVFDVTI